MNSPKPDILKTLEVPGCERLRDFYAVGPVQRAAVEAFASRIRAEAMEESAKVCEAMKDKWVMVKPSDCAADIRAAAGKGD